MTKIIVKFRCTLYLIKYGTQASCFYQYFLEKTSNFDRKWGFMVNFADYIWSIWSILTLWSFTGPPPNSLLNLTLCQNVMNFHQNIDLNFKFRYCLIILTIKLMKKVKNIKFWQKVGFYCEFCSVHLVHMVHTYPLVIHRATAKFAIKPHFMSK